MGMPVRCCTLAPPAASCACTVSLRLLTWHRVTYSIAASGVHTFARTHRSSRMLAREDVQMGTPFWILNDLFPSCKDLQKFGSWPIATTGFERAPSKVRTGEHISAQQHCYRQNPGSKHCCRFKK